MALTNAQRSYIFYDFKHNLESIQDTIEDLVGSMATYIDLDEKTCREVEKASSNMTELANELDRINLIMMDLGET